MNSQNCSQLQDTLKQKRDRLQLYYDREKLMLSPNGIKSYSIGSRNTTRYDTALKEIQDTIKQLETEVQELEMMLGGKSPRKAVGVVFRDW